MDALRPALRAPGVRLFCANPLALSFRSLSVERRITLRLSGTSPACVSQSRVPFVFGFQAPQ